MRRELSALFIASMLASVAQAQEGIASLAAPDTPAVTFIGASPAEVTQPSSGRQLLTELVSGIDNAGRVQQGLAYSTHLWYALPTTAGGVASFERYTSPLAYAWAHLELSLATVKASGADGDTHLGLGLRTLLYDEGDPLRSRTYQDALAATLQQCLPGPGDTRTPDERVSDCNKKWEEGYADAFTKTQRWNASRVLLAAATMMSLRESLLQNTRWGGFAMWANASFGIGDSAQLLAHVQYERRIAEPTSALVAGGRLNVGSARFNAFLEALFAYNFVAPDGEAPGTLRWSLGLEYRVSHQVWIAAALKDASLGGSANLAFFSALKWNITRAPEYSPF